MPRTVGLYRFNELSEEAQRRAVRHFSVSRIDLVRNRIGEEIVRDDLRDVLEKFGLSKEPEKSYISFFQKHPLTLTGSFGFWHADTYYSAIIESSMMISFALGEDNSFSPFIGNLKVKVTHKDKLVKDVKVLEALKTAYQSVCEELRKIAQGKFEKEMSNGSLRSILRSEGHEFLEDGRNASLAVDY